MVGTRELNDTTKQLFPKMLQLAGDLGCQLSPTPSNPDILRGLCPFHDATTLETANTLHINTRNARFWCIRCAADGNPLAFISRAWGISSRDAHHLLTNAAPISPDRPPYPAGYFEQSTSKGNPSPQNTALLTRASRFYASQLHTNFEPLYYLANLGVHPNLAALNGIGYAPGQGLRPYLLKAGVTEPELADSPLFGPTEDIEAFAGRLVLSDLDFTTATLWITTLLPTPPPAGSPWPEDKPSSRGIPGFKPYLFNLYSISAKFPTAILTDDPRLYIIVKTRDFPVALITQRRRATLDLSDHCGRMAHSLLNRGLTHLIMALHDTEVAAALHTTILSINPTTKVGFHTTDAIMDLISLSSRDLEQFTNLSLLPDAPPARETQPQSEDPSTPDT